MTPDGLLVTGTIRNDDTAARRQDLSVLILAFDREGQVVARVQRDAEADRSSLVSHRRSL